MKKFLPMIAALALMLGAFSMTATAGHHNNPCNPCSANPCAMKHNPCDMKKNPCDMKKDNPCDMKKSENPCNPCSMKGNDKH